MYDLGLSEREYDSAERVNYMLHENGNATVIVQDIVQFGYSNLREFKHVYVKSLIFSWIKYRPHKTMRQFLEHHNCLEQVENTQIQSNFDVIECLNAVSFDSLFRHVFLVY